MGMRVFLTGAVVLTISLPAQEIRTTQVAANISAPTDIQNAGDGSGFVLEFGKRLVEVNVIKTLSHFLHHSLF